MSKYLHGISATTGESVFTEVVSVAPIAQVAIGTAPVHLLDNPSSAVNNPIICSTMAECERKLGFSTDFKKYTLCQSMYATFKMHPVAPIVFINVLDPTKHCTEVQSASYPVNDNSIIIDDDVIVSTLKITATETEVDKSKYIAEWVEGKLVVTFTESQEGTVSVEYKKTAPEKVTTEDILGEWNRETEQRSGAELIKSIFPCLGVIPFILTAPGYSKDDTISAMLQSKAAEINGCYKGMAISDIDTTKSKTRAAAIREKKSRTLNENNIPLFPMVKKDGYIISLSAVVSALIMQLATQTDGMTCQSPSNKALNIDDVVLEDGTSVYYDQDEGNELNADGIVTVISRNGFYLWGNDTAAYPDTTDPVKRRIMSRLAFNWIENDFINSEFSEVDEPLNQKMVENFITDYNLKLSAFAAAGYIPGGEIYYNAGENPAEEIKNGHFKFHTRLATNVPGEYFENEFTFDMNILINSLTGGEE